jgi:hypothetical protein
VPAEISTSYVERQNLSLRMASRRFTQLTNAFSKKLEQPRAQPVNCNYHRCGPRNLSLCRISILSDLVLANFDP